MSTRSQVPARLRRRPAAFTIVELLVASAITLVIAGLILGLITNSLGNWNRSHGALTTESQAHAILDRLTQDLQGAIYRDDGRVWFAVTVQAEASVSGQWINGTKPADASLDPAAALLTDARFGVAGVWLRFFTTAPGADYHLGDPAAPVAVAYQIIRRTPTLSGEACHYLLYRSSVTPSGTMAAGYDLTALVYATGSGEDGSAGSLVHPGVRQIIADNVIDFGVRLYCHVPDQVTGGLRLERIFPADATDLEHQARLPPAAGELRNRFPAVADLMLRVLTEEGARQIAALESGQITGTWWAIAGAHSRVFTRRVTLHAGLP